MTLRQLLQRHGLPTWDRVYVAGSARWCSGGPLFGMFVFPAAVFVECDKPAGMLPRTLWTVSLGRAYRERLA